MSIEILDKYRGVLVGTALGDTLGMPLENKSRENVPKFLKKYKGLERISEPIDPVLNHDDEFGKFYPYIKAYKKGDITDDTILTLVLSESIAKCGGINMEDIANGHIRAYEACIMDDGSISGGFGSTTVEAIKNLQLGISYKLSATSLRPGNGPAMKMAPVGLYAHATRKYNESLKVAEEIGKVTHKDPRSVVSGVVQAHAVYALLSGVSKMDFLDSIVGVCSKYEVEADEFEKQTGEKIKTQYRGSLVEKLIWVRNNRDVDVDFAYKVLNNRGTVYQSVPFSYFMAQKYLFGENPIDGLLETVNSGGDADTNGAIYGALMGAKYGILFPYKWVNLLHEKERLLSAADGIYALKR